MNRSWESNLTVLVTGAAGYVGSITSEQLLANGFEVIAIDNFQTGHRAAVLPDVVLFEGDFGSRELLERVFRAHKVDVVDRKSTRLNSSHLVISYAVFCLKKKKWLQRADNACLRRR